MKGEVKMKKITLKTFRELAKREKHTFCQWDVLFGKNKVRLTKAVKKAVKDNGYDIVQYKHKGVYF